MITNDSLYLPMSCRTDEVQANVDSRIVISMQCSFDFQLLLQKSFELRVDVIDDGVIAVLFINLITVANSIDDGELQ